MKSKILFWGVIIFSSIILTGCPSKYKCNFNDPTILETMEGDPMYCSESCPITPTSKLVLRNIKVIRSPRAQEYSNADDPGPYEYLEKHIREKWKKALGKCPFFHVTDQQKEKERDVYFIDLDMKAVLFPIDKKIGQQIVNALTLGVARSFQDQEQIDYILSIYDSDDNLLAQGKRTIVEQHFSFNRERLSVLDIASSNVSPWKHDLVTHQVPYETFGELTSEPVHLLCVLLGKCYYALHPDELPKIFDLNKTKEKEVIND